MTASFQSQSLQRSEWLELTPVSSPNQQAFDGRARVITRANHVHPINDQSYRSIDQSQKTHTKQCKLSRCCSCIPPLVRGLLLGVLLGCAILAIVLPLWLVKTSTSRSNVPTNTPVLRWNSTGITVTGIVGNASNASNQLNYPADVIITYANDLYVADYLNHRIQKYAFGISNGTTVAGNGIIGLSAFQLCTPTRVLVDSNENLYISDTCNSRVQFWSKDARNGTTIAGVTGSSGNANNQLDLAYGIALHPISSVLYIADNNNHRIMSYTPGATNGTQIFGGQGPGINTTQLSRPVGLYYDSLSNSLFITNFDAHNVVRYAFGATTWTLAAGSINGIGGVDSASLNSPTAVVLDPMGNMYVADAGNCRIQFFSPGSMNGTTIAGISGVIGSDATGLFGPYSMALDNQLNLYVADTYNHRIQKFLRY